MARGVLQFRLERGVDDEIARRLLAVDARQLHRLVGGGVEEEVARVHDLRIAHRRRVGLGVVGGLFGRDRAGFHRGVQHPRGAGLRALSRSRRGENTDGARVKVASIAASASVTSRADLPK